MKVKLLNKDSIKPTIAYAADAGIDVYYPYERTAIWGGESTQLKLGIAIEIHEDEVAITSERSGDAIKNGLTSIGNIIDSGYRGEISIILHNTKARKIFIEKGQKIGQIVICKLGDRSIKVVDELSSTERGVKAHHSSN